MTAPTAEPPPAEQASRRNRTDNGDGMSAPEPPKLRRRPMLIAASVLLTALGALLGAWLLTSLSGTESYIAVRANIERGQVIQETDLVRTQLRTDTAIAPLGWDQQRVVVGKFATVDMAKGSLVTRDSVASEIRPSAGQTIVGLALVPGQTVSSDLRTGQPVRVVIVPASADTGSDAPTSYTGEVTSTQISEDGSTKLVDVQVASNVAPAIAGAASRQEVSLVLDTKDKPTSDGAAPSDDASSPSSSPSN